MKKRGLNMKKKCLFSAIIAIVAVIGFSTASCATALGILGAVAGSGGGETAFTPSTEQMVSALKEALKKGAEGAGANLSVSGAFYNNLARKIPLPPEAKPIIDNISRIPGGQQQIDDLILPITTAAEN
jgi:predicted small secreted protein